MEVVENNRMYILQGNATGAELLLTQYTKDIDGRHTDKGKPRTKKGGRLWFFVGLERVSRHLLQAQVTTPTIVQAPVDRDEIQG